jgi:hypothetical protein
MNRNHITRQGMTKIEFFIVMLILGAMVVFLTPAIQMAKYSGSQRICASHMQQLARAIQEYHDANGMLPPPWGPIVPEVEVNIEGDEPEEPVEVAEGSDLDKWSWRVRILPLLGEQELYDKFHFDEPWDSDHNLVVATNPPSHTFTCSRSEEPRTKEINGHEIPLTNYVMVTGPDTVGPTDGTVRTLDDITDKKGRTLMIVEVCGENRPAWTEPVDITLEDVARGLNAESGKSISGRHLSVNRLFFEDDYEGVNFCYVDGSASSYYSALPGPEELMQMAIINDGLPVEQD